MNEKSLKENILYQSVYQAIMLVIPLIISPYVTRRLGAPALGLYGFTYSIAYYFVMVSMLGIMRHGQRAIAVARGDEKELRIVFWSIYFLHLIISIAVVVLYYIFVLVFVMDNKIIYLLQGLYVISSIFDITWLFYGLENFKSVIRRNLIVKLLELILILTLVKTPNDLSLYTLIMSCSVLIGQAILVPTAIVQISPIKVSKADMIPHIKPMLVLWISVLAASMYTVFDKTLIGLMSETSNVAFYEYADKIVRVPVFLLATISTVTYPRMCNLVAKNSYTDQQNEIFNNSLVLTAFVGFASISVLISSSADFSALYYGEAFLSTGRIMQFLSPIIILISIGDIIRTQIMIPRKMDKEFVVCICINAIVNLILTAILIPLIGVYGAVIGTICAELSGVVLNTLICKRKGLLKVKELLSDVMPFAVSASIACGVAFLASSIIDFNSNIMGFIVSMIISGCTYCSISFVYLFRRKRNLLGIIWHR